MSCGGLTGLKTTVGDGVLCAAATAGVMGQKWGLTVTSADCAAPTAAEHPAASAGSAV